METIKTVGLGLSAFYYHVCKPTTDPKAILIVLHGAEGHGGRYEPLGDLLADQGIAMFALDHVNHGRVVKEDYSEKEWKDNLGKWKKDDFEKSAYNAYHVSNIAKQMYPNTPVYLLGDDYGGIMAQYLLKEYEGKFDGIIISSCGIPSSRDRRIFVRSLIRKILFFDDSKDKGTFKKRTRFLNYKYFPARTKYDWLNSDPKEVDRFIDDPLSGYPGTIGYYYYLYKCITSIPRKLKLGQVMNKQIPILFLGGGDDVITHGGRKVRMLRDYYMNNGFSNTQLEIYHRSRHDVLLEWNKDIVARDIATFIYSNSGISSQSRTNKTYDNTNERLNNFVSNMERMPGSNPANNSRLLTDKNDNKKYSVARANVEERGFVEADLDDLKLSTDLKEDDK